MTIKTKWKINETIYFLDGSKVIKGKITGLEFTVTKKGLEVMTCIDCEDDQLSGWGDLETRKIYRTKKQVLNEFVKLNEHI